MNSTPKNVAGVLSRSVSFFLTGVAHITWISFCFVLSAAAAVTVSQIFTLYSSVSEAILASAVFFLIYSSPIVVARRFEMKNYIVIDSFLEALIVSVLSGILLYGILSSSS